MKNLLTSSIALAVLSTCGFPDKPQSSKTKDHVVIAANDTNYIVYENLDDSKIYLGKCKSSDLMKLEKIYQDRTSPNLWELSRNNPCHQKAANTNGVSKTAYLNKVWELLDVGPAGEVRVTASIDALIAQINSQINQVDGSERQILSELAEMERLANQLSNDVTAKRQEQTSVQEVLNYLLNRLANSTGVDETQLANLKASIDLHQQKIRALETEISSIQSRVEALRGADATNARQRLEQIRNDLVKMRQRLQELGVNREAELNKVRALRKQTEDSLKGGVFDYVRINSSTLIPMLDSLFYQPPQDLNIRNSNNGLLEVKKEGEWRGVCDDDFGQADAIVACRQMGKKLISYEGKITGPHGKFWLDDLACDGSESSLFKCAARATGSDCGNAEWVKIKCADEPLPVVSSTRIVSDGSLQKPHCSFKRSCTWNSATQTECAEKLCQKAGFRSGKFVGASNDMCQSGFTDDAANLWAIDTDEYYFDRTYKEAQITADCVN